MNEKREPTKEIKNGCIALQGRICWLTNEPCIWRDRMDCELYWERVVPNNRAIVISMQSEQIYNSKQRTENYGEKIEKRV